MKPELVTSKTTNEIKLLLKWHPSEFTYQTLWDTETETPKTVRLLVTNVRVQIPLLSINTLEKLRVFLDRNGLKMSVEDINQVLEVARKRYGIYGGWLNATRLNYSLHGLCGVNGNPEDSLLIQNARECDDKQNGMFSTKKQLLNKHFETIGSNLRFIRSYVMRKPV